MVLRSNSPTSTEHLFFRGCRQIGQLRIQSEKPRFRSPKTTGDFFMGREQDQFVKTVEQALDGGDINCAFRQVSDDISKGRDADAANKLLSEVTTDLHKNGKLPSLARAFTAANFDKLDLDGDGVIEDHELKKIDESPLYNRSMSALDVQMIKYMRANFKGISESYNDWGRDSGISKNDLPAFETKQLAQMDKALKAQAIDQVFGKAENFNKVDSNRDGYMSDAEIKTAMKGRALSGQERDLLTYMLSNRKEISKASNDEKLWESKIHKKDVAAFSAKNQLPGMPESLATSNYYSRPALERLDTKFVPDLIVQFGNAYLKSLDLDNNGYVTRKEIERFSTLGWNKGLDPGVEKAMRELDHSLELVQRSHKDEFGYKDTKGVTQKDLETYRDHQKANLKELPQEPGDHNLSLTIGGVKRDYTVHIPPGYDAKNPLPVVYFYHYFTGNAEELAKYTSMNEAADRDKFVVVYPNAEGWVPNKLRQWNLNNNPSYRVDEVAFAKAMMDTVEGQLNVDKKRCYIAGYSNGGMLAHELAAKFSDRIAALAVVGGCQNPGVPNPSEGMPVLMMHGTKDKLVPYNGRSFTPLFPKMKSVEEGKKFWCQANGADMLASREKVGDNTTEIYRNEKNGKEVKLITMAGAGHGWPGTNHSIDGNPAKGINATDEIVKFLLSKSKSK